MSESGKKLIRTGVIIHMLHSSRLSYASVHYIPYISPDIFVLNVSIMPA